MKIGTPTSRIPHPAPEGARRAGLADAGRSRLKVGRSQNGSILVIVLWVAVGLVSIALYFANSMMYELRASDNRVNGLVADQTIEGAARYVSSILQTYGTNGMVPNNTQFACEGVPVGDAHFWLIGRDPSVGASASASTSTSTSTGPYFGLIDEASKLNLNTVTTNALSYLPNMSVDFAQAILDWCSTNESDTDTFDYSTLGYFAKGAPFESVDELRLVYGANMNLLVGDDLNLNGVLDGNEKNSSGTSLMNYGLFEYTTVWTREPTVHADGSSPTNVSTASASQMYSLLQGAGINTTYVASLTNAEPYTNMLAFAAECYTLGINMADFRKIYDIITTVNVTNTPYIYGRVNINTASGDVLMALFESLPQINGDENTASGAVQTLLSYRNQNSANLDTVMWVVDALGTSSPIITALESGDYITTRSYQFTADIAAVGAYGRGYRRVRFVFDTTTGSPIIIYRQDLSGLGWALGDKARQDLLANNKTLQ